MNKITHCKLKKIQQRRLLEFFVLEVTARSAADMLEIHPNTAALFYKKIRQVISAHLEHDAQELFDGAVELDESYFGGRRKGKRGRGAAGKVAVFGILKRQGKVYTAVVSNTRTKTLMPIISRKIKPNTCSYVFFSVARSTGIAISQKVHCAIQAEPSAGFHHRRYRTSGRSAAGRV